MSIIVELSVRVKNFRIFHKILEHLKKSLAINRLLLIVYKYCPSRSLMHLLIEETVTIATVFVLIWQILNDRRLNTVLSAYY